MSPASSRGRVLGVLTEAQWTTLLRALGIGGLLAGVYDLASAIVHAGLGRELPMLQEAAVAFGSTAGMTVAGLRLLTGILYIAGGVAVLVRAPIARWLWLAIAALLLARVFWVPLLMPEPGFYFFWRFPSRFLAVLLVLFILVVFARRNWTMEPPELVGSP